MLKVTNKEIYSTSYKLKKTIYMYCLHGSKRNFSSHNYSLFQVMIKLHTAVQKAIFDPLFSYQGYTVLHMFFTKISGIGLWISRID